MAQGLPTIRSYGDYASSNYGAHALEVYCRNTNGLFQLQHSGRVSWTEWTTVHPQLLEHYDREALELDSAGQGQTVGTSSV